MSIRTKLLILLLVITVSPLVVIGVFDLLTAKHLTAKLTADRKRLLLTDVDELLRTIVTDYGIVLKRDGGFLEHAVAVQARDAEARLAMPDPTGRKVYFEADYLSPDRWPADTVPSTKHIRLEKDGSTAAIDVSYDEQVVFLVQGVDPAAVELRLRQLSTMARTYRFLQDSNADKMYWQYTALEEGIHTSYPGHAGYPPDYDPRKRPWYTRARDAGKTVWLVLPEVSTHTVSLTVARPIFGPDGAFAGVTAIDVPMDGLFEQLQLPERWAEHAEVFLAGRGEPGTEHEDKAVVFAHQDYADTHKLLDWRKPAELQLIATDPPEEIAAMLDKAQGGTAGLVRVAVDGQPVILAHGTGVVFPVIKLPESVIDADVQAAKDELVRDVARRQAVVIALLLLVIVGVVVVAFKAAAKVTRPVLDIADAAGRLAEGDYDARVDVSGQGELKQLGDVFNRVGPQLHERERIKHALSVAMDVQQNLLPKTTPKRDGLDVAGRSTYCDETGGDYYDYLDIIDLDDQSIAIVVGDVMGHGVAAAMLMATARGILRSRCQQPGSLADLLNHLNALLVEDTGGTRFMTMLLMTIDAKTRTIRWASAGHDMPLVVCPDHAEPPALDGSGLPLGIMAEESYEEYRVDGLPEGAALFAATDGVWEMKNPSNEQFGKQRVIDLIRTHLASPSQDISHALHTSLQAFRDTGEQDDDVTYVLVKLG